MSLETKIEALTAAVTQLIQVMQSGQAAPAPVTPAPLPVPVPVAAAPQMPALPVFAAAAGPTPTFAAPASPVVPFVDGAGLIAYVMAVYKEVGPAKGAGIQNVLTTLGYQNINDVRPEHYAQLYAGVEALKK